MSNLYSMFKTDNDLEKAGIVLSYGVTDNGDPIEIRIARAGGANTAYAKRMETLVKPYRRQIQNETMDNAVVESIVREVYAETVVLGWKNVQDKDGVVIVFSKEACVKLFTDLPELFADIQAQSQKVALFREEILETDSKN